MTPKEKAEEFINKIQNVLYDNGAGHESSISYNEIKNICFVLIDEFIKEIDEFIKEHELLSDEKVIIKSSIEYWKQVKTEIEKL